jgi:hypothetical protein
MDNFWSKVMPACVTDFNWGKDMTGLNSEKAWEKSLKNVLVGLDDGEFNLFLAKVVIKASGAGVVGVDLTSKVTLLKELRTK